jgi:hypothetical protein
MAGGGGSPRLYQNADFITADFGCDTKKLVATIKRQKWADNIIA